MISKNFRIASCLAILVILPNCSKLDVKKEFPKTRQQKEEDRIGKLTGNGITFGKVLSGTSSSTSNINVNTYLWRASLDQVSFMPLNSTDSAGGIIITDWYTMSDNSKERYKINIYILDKNLSSNSIKVNVYKQDLGKNSVWGNQYSDQNLAHEIKDKIIERSRKLKANSDIAH